MLSSSASLPSGVSTLSLCHFSFKPHQLRQFAALFPEVESVLLFWCSFAPEQLIKFAEGSSKITYVSIVLRKDVKGDALDQFCEGLLRACSAIQALRAERGRKLTLDFRRSNNLCEQALHRTRGVWLERMAGSSAKVELNLLN